MFTDDELYQIRDVLNDKIKFLMSCHPTKEEFVQKNLDERRKMLRIVSKIEKQLLGGENA